MANPVYTLQSVYDIIVWQSHYILYVHNIIVQYCTCYHIVHSLQCDSNKMCPYVIPLSSPPWLDGMADFKECAFPGLVLHTPSPCDHLDICCVNKKCLPCQLTSWLVYVGFTSLVPSGHFMAPDGPTLLGILLQIRWPMALPM